MRAKPYVTGTRVPPRKYDLPAAQVWLLAARKRASIRRRQLLQGFIFLKLMLYVLLYLPCILSRRIYHRALGAKILYSCI